MKLPKRKLGGIKPVMTEVGLRIVGGRITVPAVVYDQWAVHEDLLGGGGLSLSHVPIGRRIAKGLTARQVRELIALILPTKPFKTMRAEATIRELGRIVRTWRKSEAAKGGKTRL